MSNPAPTNPEPPPPAKSPRRRSILDAGPWVLLFLTLAGSCGAWHAALDLCAHFRWYYFVISLVWGLAIWKRVRSWVMCGLVVTILWNGGLLAPYYLPFTQPAVPDRATTVSLISLNVFSGNRDKAAVLAYLRDRQPDLIVAMEVDDRWQAALEELRDLYPHRFIQPLAGNFGIGLLSKLPLIEPRFVKYAHTDLPNIVTQINKDGLNFVLVATHPLPPIGSEKTRKRDAQLLEVADLARELKFPCVVAGDFNTTPWSSGFRDFQTRSGLRDSSLGRGVQGSWNAKQWLIRIPIDHVFVPQNAAVRRRVLGPYVGSDHLPVEVTIAFP